MEVKVQERGRARNTTRRVPQNFTLARSKSSPSPPPNRNSNAASKQTITRREPSRKGLRKLASIGAEVPRPPLDWSTSYQAGSSSSASSAVSDSDNDETDTEQSRGRQPSIPRQLASPKESKPVSRRRPSIAHTQSGSNDSGNSSSTLKPSRQSFTRSRSPAVPRKQPAKAPSNQRIPNPLLRQKQAPRKSRHLLPAVLQCRVHIPFSTTVCTFSVDARRAGECAVLLSSLAFAGIQVSDLSWDFTRKDVWVATELFMLLIAASVYTIWAHTSTSTLSASKVAVFRPTDPRKRTPSNSLPRKDDAGYVWMSVPKNYRTSSDDGLLSGLLLVPLIATAMLYSSQGSHPSTLLPPTWKIEAPAMLSNSRSPPTALDALILARYNLVDMATFCSTMLLSHVCASWWWEARHRAKAPNAPEGERSSVPRSEGKRTWYFAMFTWSLTGVLLGLQMAFRYTGIRLWQHMSYFQVIAASQLYQFALYVCLRLAHRGFTLGELGLVAFGGTSLGIELLNITVAKIWPVTTPFIKTYRLPTPLLIFQMALIPGSFLTGFLLSPLLVLSRHIAQRPVRRMKFPHDKTRHRWMLAVCFYAGSVLIVGTLVGFWTQWCLAGRNPWTWAFWWILDSRTRVGLLVWWGVLGSLSVAGWSRQLARSRRYRSRTAGGGDPSVVVPIPMAAANSAAGGGTGSVSSAAASMMPDSPMVMGTGIATGIATGITFPNLGNSGANVTEFLDAANKHVPTLGLNARRKFFHALSVVMFVPGIAYDPAFTHLAFSVAFALFVFAEYVRYFAVYPFGAALHLYMNEFLDHKDGGTAILSHFYLLTGCAGSLWLEGHSLLLQFTGIFALGVGDSLASIVGKRAGKYRWSPTTPKTIEGSIAYTLSVVTCAWILRLLGHVESFSTVKYTLVVGMSSMLEALSVQNDNLTVPLYMWSMLTLVGL